MTLKLPPLLFKSVNIRAVNVPHSPFNHQTFSQQVIITMERTRVPLRDITHMLRRVTIEESQQTPAGQHTATPPPPQPPPPSQQDPYKLMDSIEWVDWLIARHRPEFNQFNCRC